MKKNFILFFCLLIASYSLAQIKFEGKKVNTNPINEKYKKSRKHFYGQLNSQEYDLLIGEIEKELITKIPAGKSVFISYEQAAENCSLLGGNKQYLKGYHDLYANIANRITTKNNAVPYFLYNSNSFLIEYVSKNPKYIVDKGFFASNIFTLKENCAAFFVLKPNGNFMICYGTDALSDADNFLKID